MKVRTARLVVLLLLLGVATAQDDDEQEVEIPFQDINEEHIEEDEGMEEFPFVQGKRVDYIRGTTSRFWGKAGELFDYTGRMSDWSWAGYRMGEKPIPTRAATYDLVANFGAVPDDGLSDTDAFLQAFRVIPVGGVLFIPQGTFILDRQVWRNISIVIRGAGRDKTKIYMPKCFWDLTPWQPSPAVPLSPWRDGPFFLHMAGQLSVNTRTLLGPITTDAWRGERFVTMRLELGKNLAVGQLVRIVAGDRDHSLVTHMYGNLTAADWRRPATVIVNASPLIYFASRVRSMILEQDVDDGGAGGAGGGGGAGGAGGGGSMVVLELERPLPWDLKPSAWRNVAVHQFSATALYETGIEDLSMEFAPGFNHGHLQERGYNALSMTGCVNCWARRLRFTNADFGLHVGNSFFVTVDDIIFDNTTERTAAGLSRFGGHHAIRFARTSDCLAKNMRTTMVFMHDITVDHQASLNVFHNYSGPDVSMDFHGSAPSMNLMSRINCGRCTRTWASGGSATSGGHAGVFNMAWGLTGGTPASNIAPMWSGFGANFTIIGAPLNAVPSFNGFMLEALDPTTLKPYDLHAAQLAWRLRTNPHDAVSEQHPKPLEDGVVQPKPPSPPSPSPPKPTKSPPPSPKPPSPSQPPPYPPPYPPPLLVM